MKVTSLRITDELKADVIRWGRENLGTGEFSSIVRQILADRVRGPRWRT